MNTIRKTVFGEEKKETKNNTWQEIKNIFGDEYANEANIVSEIVAKTGP